MYSCSNYWQQIVRQLCNFALRPLSFNIITVCVLSKNVRQLCFTHARIGYCRVRCVRRSTTGHHCSCWVQCRCGKLSITGRNSDNISWMPGILRAPCTLVVGYSVGLLGGRPEGTTLNACGFQCWYVRWPSRLRFICRHTNIPPLIYLFFSCNCDFLSLMPTYNQCALYVESIVKSDVKQLVKLTCVYRPRCATILKPCTSIHTPNIIQCHN